MSITIGIGYSTKSKEDLFDELKKLSEKFGYALLKGLHYVEKDVKLGLEVAQQNEGWESIVLLQSPPNNNQVALAFDIDQELSHFRMTKKRPRFFDFLNELSEICSQRCKKVGIFFSGDWYSDDRVRYSYGDFESLITLLSMPGHWGMLYQIPQTGRLQESDETPFIFDLRV